MKLFFIPKNITSSYTYFKLMNEGVSKIKCNGLVLDIGARSAHYSKQFKKYISLDVVPSEHVDVVADAHSLPFKKNTFDLILILGVLEYTWDPQKVINEIYRTLKPGGRLVATALSMAPYHPSKEIEDYWRYTIGSVRRLLSNFSSVKIKNKGSLFSLLSIYYENFIQKFHLTIFYPIVKIFHAIDKIFNYKNTAVFYFVEAKK